MITATLVILGLAAVIWFGQRGLIYFPRSDVPSLVDAGLRHAEAIDFMTEDELRLEGWFVPAAGAPSGHTVIVFNGNAGHRGYRAELAQRFAAHGLATLLFDYRGYGGNPGLPSERGLARDARAALAYLRQRPDVDRTRIVYFGESLGAAVAVGLAAEDAAGGVDPALAIRIAGRDGACTLPRSCRDGGCYGIAIHRSTGSPSIRSPLLVIAGDADRIVPLDQSVALYEAGERSQAPGRAEGRGPQ